MVQTGLNITASPGLENPFQSNFNSENNEKASERVTNLALLVLNVFTNSVVTLKGKGVASGIGKQFYPTITDLLKIKTSKINAYVKDLIFWTLETFKEESSLDLYSLKSGLSSNPFVCSLLEDLSPRNSSDLLTRTIQIIRHMTDNTDFFTFFLKNQGLDRLLDLLDSSPSNQISARIYEYFYRGFKINVFNDNRISKRLIDIILRDYDKYEFKDKSVITFLLGFVLEEIVMSAYKSDLLFVKLTENLLDCRDSLVKYEDKSNNDLANKLRTLSIANLFALRLILSIPKNIRLFKTVYPTTLYTKLITIKSIKNEPESYSLILSELLSLSGSELSSFRESLSSVEFVQLERHTTGKAFKTVSGYQLNEVVGQGAYGKVYYATKEGQGYAVKEINGEDNSEGVEGIAQEIRLLAKLDHPNITNYVEAFKKGSFVYIVMEFVEGLSLLEYIKCLQERDAMLQKDTLRKIVVDLLMVLYYLHKECQIIHRDLNPSNIMIDFECNIKVTDFGLSKELTDRLTKEKIFEGTLAYSPPETIENTGSDEKVDIWSLGCIVYELVTFKQAFSHSNPLALAKAVTSLDLEPLPPGAPYRSLVSLCLTLSPEERPDSRDLLCHLIDDLVPRFRPPTSQIS